MKNVLCVDDSRVVRKMINLSLSGHVNLVEALNGAEGLDLCKSQPFDLIITDINMPIMDGLEMIQRIRALPSYLETPILCITTEASTATKMKGRDAGANGWVVKPFSPESLRGLVAKFLNTAL